MVHAKIFGWFTFLYKSVEGLVLKLKPSDLLNSEPMGWSLVFGGFGCLAVCRKWRELVRGVTGIVFLMHFFNQNLYLSTSYHTFNINYPKFILLFFLFQMNPKWKKTSILLKSKLSSPGIGLMIAYTICLSRGQGSLCR